MPNISASAISPRPIVLVSETSWPDYRLTLSVEARTYADAMGFGPKTGAFLVLPAANGQIDSVLFGIGTDDALAKNPFLTGKIATDCPAGHYVLHGALSNPTLALLGFYLGLYRFDRFKSVSRKDITLSPPSGADAAHVQIVAQAMTSGRDLINRPANDLTTDELASAAKALAARFGVEAHEIVGDALIEQGFPLIHAVGRAAAFAPRLIEFVWGDTAHPKVTLVGKGVVFDTGGLNLKPDNSMLLMKKDMGGAATALTAAEIIMASGSKVRLRVIVAIVENSVAGSAFRPGDIYRSRKGITVEIGNTDAEGRLILADALAYADEDKPDLLMDFATLTGAARVALGPDLPPFFTQSDSLAKKIEDAAQVAFDPVWRLPLWQPYVAMLESKTADINNVSSGGFAGAITAALFLQKFVENAGEYVHFDMYGWTPSPRPGRPEGGEPQVARLVAQLVARSDR